MSEALEKVGSDTFLQSTKGLTSTDPRLDMFKKLQRENIDSRPNIGPTESHKV